MDGTILTYYTVPKAQSNREYHVQLIMISRISYICYTERKQAEKCKDHLHGKRVLKKGRHSTSAHASDPILEGEPAYRRSRSL